MTYPTGCGRSNNANVGDPRLFCKSAQCNWPRCTLEPPMPGVSYPVGYPPPQLPSIADWAMSEAMKRADIKQGMVWDEQTRLLIELAARLIQQYEQPPVDPLIKRAREILKIHIPGVPCDAGEKDDNPILLAIKQALSETPPNV